MKYIKTFEKYNTGDINEGILSTLKNFFSKLFANIDQAFSEQGDKLLKEIEAKKNPKDVFITMKGFLDVNKKTFTTEINKATTLNKVRDAVYSNVVLLEASFKAASTKLNNSKVSFEQIFGNAAPKEFQKLFSQKDDKNKQKAMEEFSNSMVENMGKGIGIKDFEELKLKVGEEAKTSGTTTGTPPPAGTPPAGTPPAGTPPPDTKQLTNLKKLISDWFNNNVYMKIYKNMEALEKESPAQATTLDQQINNIKITNNKNGVKKMINSILNFDDDNKLGNLRDAMAKLGYINKDDVGKF
jgi:hypothetical protein